VFALLREESEKVSELKNVSGSNKLPYGTLALGSEGIREAINGFDDARKSDIENERLPPELFDVTSEEGRALISNSAPTTPPGDRESTPISSNGIVASFETRGGGAAMTSPPPLTPPLSGGSASPVSPPPINTSFASSPSPLGSPTSASGSITPFRRGHSRNASLGTTMTSPSTRRRSLESTMSLIQGVWDGNVSEEGNRIPEGDEAVEGLTKQFAAAGSSWANSANAAGGSATGAGSGTPH